MIDCIIYIIFFLFILFVIWFIACSILYGDKPTNDYNSQSERQKQNEDYNSDYYL